MKTLDIILTAIMILTLSAMWLLLQGCDPYRGWPIKPGPVSSYVMKDIHGTSFVVKCKLPEGPCSMYPMPVIR